MCARHRDRRVWTFSVGALLGLLCGSPQATAGLVGLWEFEDGGNLGLATVGSDLTAVGGTFTVGSGGPDTGAISLDVNERLEIANPIGGNGGGGETNIYSVVIDFNQAPGDFQAVIDTSNSSDGEADIFINSSDTIGISGNYGGTPFTSDEWHRMVMVFDMTAADELLVYRNGSLARMVEPVNGVDGRWSLESVFALFSDGQTGGEERLTSVSNVALYDVALTPGQVANLGGPGRLIPEPGSAALLGLGALLLLARRRS